MKKKEASKKVTKEQLFWILIKQQVGTIIAKKSFLSYKMVCSVFSADIPGIWLLK